MKASELRIGNLVESQITITHKVANALFLYQISELKSLKTEVCNYYQPLDTTNLYYKDLKPIPITEGWLSRFGFESIKHVYDGMIFKKDWLRIANNMLSWEWRGGYIRHSPKYVHQLQNLYFALTGEELTIKQTA